MDLAWALLIPFRVGPALFFDGMRVLSDMGRLPRGGITPDQALTV